MIKIGIDCENLEDSKSRWGIGHLVLSLLKEYAQNSEWKNKYKLYLYFKRGIPKDDIFNDPIFEKKVIARSLPSFNIYYHLFLPLAAYRDHINIMFFPAYMLPPLYIKRSIVTLTEDLFYEIKKGSLPFRYKLAYSLFSNWAATAAWKILAFSESSKQEVAKLFKVNPDRVIAAHLGVEKKNISTENKYGDYILYVGQMFPRRSAKELIKGFGLIADKYPDLKLILVGKDKYPKETIKPLVEKINSDLGSERIIHHEYIVSDTEVHTLMAHAKALAYISSHEAFGLPPVEAALYGTPVIVKNSLLNHEIFGDNALFIDDESNLMEIGSAIEKVVDDQELVTKFKTGYVKIGERFSWKKFAEKFFSSLDA